MFESLHLNHLLCSHFSCQLTVAIDLGAERNILVARRGTAGESLSSRPDLCVCSDFFFVVLLDRFANLPLEEQRAFLHGGVHLAVDKDASAEVPLSVHAEIFVFRHDTLIHIIDELKVIIIGILVSEHFVLHGGSSGANGDESLSEEKVWSVRLC